MRKNNFCVISFMYDIFYLPVRLTIDFLCFNLPKRSVYTLATVRTIDKRIETISVVPDKKVYQCQLFFTWFYRYCRSVNVLTGESALSLKRNYMYFFYIRIAEIQDFAELNKKCYEMRWNQQLKCDYVNFFKFVWFLLNEKCIYFVVIESYLRKNI